MNNNNQKDLNYYLLKFKNIRRDAKNGGAPHKPILLLSVINLFEINPLQPRQIYISPELIGLFKSNWAKLVESSHHMIFALPFFHMKSDGFWQLIAKPGCEKWITAQSGIRSFSSLNIAVECAEIDNELRLFLEAPGSREVLKQFILGTYFPNTHYRFETKSVHNTLDEIRKNIREETSSEYKQELSQLKAKLDNNAFEEEIFIRGSLFKREIPKIYNNTCAITGLRVDAVINISMIDACHIVPFSEAYDDTVTNGIALCPNLHRAFDRGLISIDENYRVITGSIFTEPVISTHSLRQFEGLQINFPNSEQFFPAQDNLSLHRKKHGYSN